MSFRGPLTPGQVAGVEAAVEAVKAKRHAVQSGVCLCGGRKKAGFAFCLLCMESLPAAIRLRLSVFVSTAYDEARAYLEAAWR